MFAKSALVVALALLAGCSTAAPQPGFTATLVSPTDIELAWPDDDPAAAGTMVEYATDPAGPWTTLQFLPAHRSSYRHPDLIPETPFYYRVRPFYGPVSPEVLVGQPGAFHASVSADRTVKFTWTDQTTDEDGFLVEIRRPGAPGFEPIEVSDPDTTSCVLSLLDGEQGSAYRLRTLHYGPVSPVAHQTTGKDS